MKIIIVDEADNVVDPGRDIDMVDWNSEIHRASAIFLYNQNDEVLLAQRALDKRMSPGLWGPSAAGIVEAHETYEINVITETKEEIGVDIDENSITLGPKILIKRDDPKRQFWMQFFFAINDYDQVDFVLQTEEVAAVKWINKKELLKDLEENSENYADVFEEVIINIPN